MDGAVGEWDAKAPISVNFGNRLPSWNFRQGRSSGDAEQARRKVPRGERREVVARRDWTQKQRIQDPEFLRLHFVIGSPIR